MFSTMNDDERRNAGLHANRFCHVCQGTGVVTINDHFGIEALPGFEYEDMCECAVPRVETFRWHQDCTMCHGEGLIRGLDWGDGPGGMEYAWEVCDCDVNPPRPNMPPVPFEF